MTNVGIMYPTKQLYNTQHMQTLDNFGYRPPHRKSIDCKSHRPRDKKRPTKWVRPPSQRGKDESRSGLEETKVRHRAQKSGTIYNLRDELF